ncbi:hypothetical protein D9M71_141380 [compost metagenome]
MSCKKRRTTQSSMATASIHGANGRKRLPATISSNRRRTRSSNSSRLGWPNVPSNPWTNSAAGSKARVLPPRASSAPKNAMAAGTWSPLKVTRSIRWASMPLVPIAAAPTSRGVSGCSPRCPRVKTPWRTITAKAITAMVMVQARTAATTMAVGTTSMPPTWPVPTHSPA